MKTHSTPGSDSYIAFKFGLNTSIQYMAKSHTSHPNHMLMTFYILIIVLYCSICTENNTGTCLQVLLILDMQTKWRNDTVCWLVHVLSIRLTVALFSFPFVPYMQGQVDLNLNVTWLDCHIQSRLFVSGPSWARIPVASPRSRFLAYRDRRWSLVHLWSPCVFPSVLARLYNCVQDPCPDS